jgi:hypothetical protein
MGQVIFFNFLSKYLHTIKIDLLGISANGNNLFGIFITHFFTNSTYSSDTSYALGRVLAIAIDISIDD